jgi:preprotein translocase subunit SecF
VDFVGRRYWFFLISAILLLPGVFFLIIAPGLKQGIDFTGGSSLTLKFTTPVDEVDIRSALSGIDHSDARVQQDQDTDNTFFIHTKELQEEDKNAVVAALSALTPGAEAELLTFDLVSAAFAREILLNAFWAVLAAAVGIFFFLWWAFRRVPNPIRYGTAALVALLHDSLAVVGIFAMLGVLFDVEVNTMFFIAFLLVYGYSVNDTIVIFDRLRENTLSFPNRTLAVNVNVSISESIGRSLNTSLTLLFTLLALLLFGGSTIREFLWVLIIGVVVGTYSSIGVATSLLVAWDAGDFGRLLRRRRRSPDPSRAA